MTAVGPTDSDADDMVSVRSMLRGARLSEPKRKVNMVDGVHSQAK